MAVQFSKHASSRLYGRFRGVVSQSEVVNAVKAVGSFGLGETAIRFKRFDSIIIRDDSDGSASVGDIVVAVYRRSSEDDKGVVATIELRGSWQSNPARWSKVIDLL